MASEPDNKSVGIHTDRVTEFSCDQCGCRIDVTGLDPFVGVECPDCGKIEPVPAKLGPFLLTDLIGMGGMGGVYHAIDPSLGRHVAIKVMLSSLGENKAFVESFKREAQAVARLNHPNIVQIYSFGEEKGQPYIVMELVNGQRLDKMMEGGKQLEQSFLIHVAADVASALKAADEIGLIHGDIKPENILLDEKGRAKLVDFGLATFAHQHAPEGIWGTPYYIAPEKVKRQPADARSDIFSLGATLYHALSGRPPFEGKTPIEVVKARLTRTPAALHVLVPKIDRNVEALVTRMLDIQPSRRHPNYSSLISDLQKAMELLGPVKTTMQKLVAKKQTSSVSTESGTIEKPGEPPAPVSTRAPKVLIMAKKDGASPPPSTSAPKAPKLVLHRNEAVAVPKGSDSPQKRPGVAPRKIKKISKLKVWTIISLFLLAIGTGVGYGLVRWHKARVAEAWEKLALSNEKKAANAALPQFQPVINKIAKWATAIREPVTKATNAVFVVTGELLPVDEPPAAETNDPPAEGEAPPPESKPESKPDSKAESKPAAKPAAKPAKSDDPDEPPPAAGKKASDNDAPFGEPTREMLDRQRKRAQKKSEPAPKPPAEPAPEKPPAEEKKAPPPEEAAPPPPPKEEPEITVLAKQVLAAAQDISAKENAANDLAAQSAAIRDEIMKAATSQIAKFKNKQISTNLVSVQAMELEAKQTVKNSEKTVQKIEELKVAHEKKQAAIKKQQEEEEARKKAEEEAKRKAEELKVAIENEKKLVVTAHEAVSTFLKQNLYKDALDSLNSQLATYQTEEGKKAFQVLIDRAERLIKLRNLMIEHLNAEPFSWGWTQDKQAQDIMGADAKMVKLRTKSVPWGQVSPSQMHKMITNFLAKKKFTVRDEAETQLSVAVFYFEQGKLDIAKRHATRSIELREDMKTEVDRLLPLE